MSACRSCGARVRWALTVNNKRQPFDYEPSDDGTFVLHPVRGALHAIYAPEAGAGDAKHTSHFATCPDADRWRR